MEPHSYLVGLFWLLVVTCFLLSAAAIKYLTQEDR